MTDFWPDMSDSEFERRAKRFEDQLSLDNLFNELEARYAKEKRRNVFAAQIFLGAITLALSGCVKVGLGQVHSDAVNVLLYGSILAGGTSTLLGSLGYTIKSRRIACETSVQGEFDRID